MSLSEFKLFMLGVVVALLAILIGKSCNCHHDLPVVQSNPYQDSLIKLRSLDALRADTLKKLKEQEDYNNSVIEQTGVMFFEADSAAKDNEARLKEAQRQLALARKTNDTAHQIKNCDELDRRATMFEQKYEDADKLATEYVFKTTRELYHKDSIIEVQDGRIDGLERQNAVNYMILSHSQLQSSEKTPFLRGYIGLTGAVGVYNGIGPKLDLLTRKEMMYSGNVKFGLGGPVYEVGVTKLISFKKR